MERFQLSATVRALTLMSLGLFTAIVVWRVCLGPVSLWLGIVYFAVSMLMLGLGLREKSRFNDKRDAEARVARKLARAANRTALEVIKKAAAGD